VLDSHGGGRHRTGRFHGVASDWRCTIHLPSSTPDDGEADGGVACVAGAYQITDGIGVAIDADGHRDGDYDRSRSTPRTATAGVAGLHLIAVGAIAATTGTPAGGSAGLHCGPAATVHLFLQGIAGRTTDTAPAHGIAAGIVAGLHTQARCAGWRDGHRHRPAGHKTAAAAGIAR